MPLNAGPEFFRAQEKYRDAKTREEKLAALEEMLRTCPTHKGADKLRAELKSKLAKLRKQKTAKAARRSFGIPKEGDAQVCIIGLTQSGKSTLLRKLTNATPEVSNRPFTTTSPQIGVIEWTGVRIQLIEIPSTWNTMFMSVAQNADGIVLLLDGKKDLNEQREELGKVIRKFRIKRPMIEVISKDHTGTEETNERIFQMLGLIRIYTKEAGKEPEKKALVLKRGSSVRNATSKIHKDFLKYFKFARVWGRSAKYPGEMVGLEHVLKDGDILEIRKSS